jgi:hypothetical protein
MGGGGGGQGHAPAALPSEKKTGTRFTGGWARPSAGLNGRGKSRPHGDSILGPLSP